MSTDIEKKIDENQKDLNKKLRTLQAIAISLLILIVIIAIILIGIWIAPQQSSPQATTEFKYLVVQLVNDSNLTTSKQDADSIMLSGGALVISPTQSGIRSITGQETNSNNEYALISSLLNYLGIFHWVLDDVDGNTIYMHR